MNWEQFIRDQLVPSKRMVKTRSGRAVRKQYNGRKYLQSVGGRSNLAAAIFAPPTEPMCRIVPMDTGWLPDGRPNRL